MACHLEPQILLLKAALGLISEGPEHFFIVTYFSGVSSCNQFHWIHNGAPEECVRESDCLPVLGAYGYGGGKHGLEL